LNYFRRESNVPLYGASGALTSIANPSAHG
jgi:hypothetical protein